MPELNSTRILYMEDDEGLAVLLQRNLHRRGYTVDIAPNGQEGIERTARSIYDIILIDYDMPVMCGIDVLRHLNKNGEHPPVIMVTGNGSEKTAVEALKEGASDYIVKDVDLHYFDLLPIIIEQVREKQQLLAWKIRITEKLQENESRYRSLVELSPDGIAIVKEDKIVFVNAAGTRLLGSDSTDDLIGRTFIEFVDAAFRESTGRLLNEMTHCIQWPVSRNESRLLRLDGSGIDVEMAGLSFTQGGETAFQIIIRDITDRKRSEAERDQLIHDLESALHKVKTLCGLVPICSSCKKIRDDKGYWNHLETYIEEHSNAEFTHGFCPECAEHLYQGCYRARDKNPVLDERQPK